MPPTFDLILKGGQVATPGGIAAADVGVSHGRIAAIGSFDASQAGEVFDAHAANPQFIRLVMGENLLGGRTVQQAPEIRQTNLLGLEELQTILQRGQADGSMRPDLAVMEVYANAVAMAFHFVSNRSTFSAIFEQGSDPAQVQAARRACIQDTIERQVVTRA